ncbi:hypothetical protein B0O80DRAFT_227060 [Mortierella sp. GBAus27b]|nr:hypothetical protein BGX31_004738 [Mortierella sp. GBA43]KAI8359257.1 hypothetical protein B0O80DRAFT_227060 [Mortierella sp. GBAus27b]
MLSLIRPSSSPCLHQDASPAAGPNTPTDASSPASPSSSAAPANLKPQSSLAAPLKSSGSYRECVSQFTAKAPQPYGIIPPRKKRLPKTSISTASLKKAPSSSPPSPIETSRNAVELKSTSLSRNESSSSSSSSADNGSIIQPLFQSLQSFLPESTSSTRLGFWANLKAHMSPNVTLLSWPTSDNNNNITTTTPAAPTKTSVDEFSPPSALRLSNSTPVAAINATQLSVSVILTDDLQSLPNITATSVQTQQQHGSVNFPVSVAAMDKFKSNRSDTIPLKTFTYSETPVVEHTRFVPPVSPRLSPSLPDYSRQQHKTTSVSLSSLSPSSSPASKGDDTKDAPCLPALPRHLATRETRSNTDYLRMMAAELRMIRSRKLVSPLKPRGYLPRRKDPFRRVKSPLCNCIELVKEEDDHPLNNLTVGSWSSMSSESSFQTASSSEYQSVSDIFC